MTADKIVIRGAAEHNLRRIDLELPRQALIVLTGVSGSGKSSLAFDTLYAEGQRRYVESLSTDARQFLERMPKPEVDSIEGLSPAIAIEQRTTVRHPRSTVGTVTEIYDFLRLLFARVGQPHCPGCRRPVSAQTVQQIVDTVLALPEGTRIQVLAPRVRDRKGTHRRELREVARRGFVRVRVDGAVRELDDGLELDPQQPHTIEVVVDRLRVQPGLRARLTDSVETALAEGGGDVIVHAEEEDHVFSRRLVCPACGSALPPLEPRLFSFNTPQGACPECDGLGWRRRFEPRLILADPQRSLGGGALAWGDAGWWRAVAQALLPAYGVEPDTPYAELPEAVQRVLWSGGGEREFEFVWTTRRGSHRWRRRWEGLLALLERRYRDSESEARRERLERLMAVQPCAACSGARLRREALAVRVGGESIAQHAARTVSELRRFYGSLHFAPRDAFVAAPILREIMARLAFLEDVGLGYMALDRPTTTLSGGEAQRIRLATQIGAHLTGVLYILDEPSAGLHPRDQGKLIDSLRAIRDQGNTVLVVEHDPQTILAADHVVDLGPGAGEAGGRVVAQGPPEAIAAAPDSLTGAYLSGRRRIEVPLRRRRGSGAYLTVVGARQHNLKGITVRFPLGTLTCVTGVSGSGKSTLVHDILYRALARALHGAEGDPGGYEAILGAEHAQRVVRIDPSPIGRTPRSNAATYVGLFAAVRERFALVPEARARGYKPSRFSFNVPGGRCETCRGEGLLRIAMHFLPDVFVPCDACGGRRYNRETLEIVYKGRTIHEVLEMRVEEALEFFSALPQVREKLEALRDVGLGYLRLGQPATTLSGGEAQRVKLARELARRGPGHTVYLLDEPTTGLHFEDVRTLLAALERLVDQGHTVIVIEHNLEVVKCADWVVDLGPEGGEAGGRVVACGTPEEIAGAEGSWTGRYLRQVLEAARAGEPG